MYLPRSLSRVFSVNSLSTMATTMSPTLARLRFSTTATSPSWMPASIIESPLTGISVVSAGGDPCPVRRSFDETGCAQAGQYGLDPGLGGDTEHLAQLGVGGDVFPVSVIVLEFGEILAVLGIEVRRISHDWFDTERMCWYCKERTFFCQPG